MTLILHWSLLLTFHILLHRLLTALTPKQHESYMAEATMTAFSPAFFICLLPLTILLTHGTASFVTIWHWINSQSFDVIISFNFDQYALVFFPLAVYVSSSMLELSLWYMDSDPNIHRIFYYPLVLLVVMIIVVSANNFFQLFIRWERVGIMSLLLIGCWYGPAVANTAALLAVIFNRVRDIALIMTAPWFAMSLNSWENQQRLTLSKDIHMSFALIWLIVAATRKSAHFGLHPQLPAAIEGPTRVSALLHSTTMVDAGIFLLIRFHPLTENNQLALTTCLCLGALTSLFAATCALTQNDIKKLVAFSTSSQLALMMVAMGLNQWQLAFVHISTHAYFLAMFFLSSGSIMHSVNHDQEIRKLGALLHTIPSTSGYWTIGSLGLTATPFQAGFFTKDAFIAALGSSYLNAWRLTVTLIATSFSALYSFHLVFLVNMGPPRILPVWPIHEYNLLVINPVKRRACGSMTAALFISQSLTRVKTPNMTMPGPLKMAALLVAIMRLFTAISLATMTRKHLKFTPTIRWHHLSNILWFFPMTVLRFVPKLKFMLGQSAAAHLDKVWLEAFGRKALAFTLQNMAKATNNFSRRMIKTYVTIILLTLIMPTTVVLL
uniref:NADH-ubiquinone oxidoreductase chain 5 n=1 Tax=Acrossocheilus paradoxus TaxID=76593 RepID=A0A125R6X4_ACRPD|nr:NADH dehydrogenase subunit 5 [Acrossocheilus paradoxus]AMD11931.1 NADH dehydrogenase subunit 5 [Acrossocheilus paradoxus]